jgi:lipase chaperone LimK
LIQTVRAAAEALHRERVGRETARRLAEMQGDPEAWADYLADADSTAVTDGIG